jgi:jumonji domain-containing protein 7
MNSGEVIERISAKGLDPDDFVRQYVAENTPVILQDALPEAWDHALTWTPERLAELAEKDLHVRVAPLMADGRDKWIENADLWPGAQDAEPLPGILHTDRVLAVAAARIDVPIADFVASLRGEGSLPSLYADGANNFDHSFSYLASDLPGALDIGDSLLFKTLHLWLGGRTLSTLHFDNYENLFAQLVGEKEFLLCPPGDANKLVDGRLRKAYASWCAEDGSFQRAASGISNEAVMNYAAYDIDAPPVEYAERAAKLRRSLVRVRAGEVLYLPFGWWHQVRAVPGENGLCASAACFYEPFFVRLQPKALTKVGPLLPNPKYRKLCERLHLGDSSDEEESEAANSKTSTGGYNSGQAAVAQSS